MKARLKKSISILMMLFCMLFFNGVTILAAEGSVTYGSTSYTATQGESFQVGVYVKGSEAIGSYEFYLDYNPDMIEYVSGADAGGAGRLKFVGYGNSSSYSYMLTFRASTAGNCTISISGADLGPLDPASGDSMTITKMASAPITIQGPSTASDDCTLSSLTLSPTGLYGFSPEVTEYDITVANDVTKLSISATPSDSKATYVISDTNLSVGVNTIKITVTAESGATKTYSIIVRRKQEEATESQPETTTKKAEPETTTKKQEVETTTKKAETETTTKKPEPETTTEKVETETTTEMQTTTSSQEELDGEVTFLVNGKDMFVSSVPDDVSLPEGFSETMITYRNTEIPAYAGSTQNVTLFYLEDGLQNNGGFYVYDTESNSVYPYIVLENEPESYILLSVDESVQAPVGYTRTTVALAGGDSESVQTNVTAWVSDTNEEFFLVYALNSAGETEFYQYDTKEKTLQRYIGGATGDTSDVSALKEALVSSRLENQKSSKLHFMIIIALAALSVLFLFVIIGLMMKMKNMTGTEEAIYEEPAKEEIKQTKAEQKASKKAEKLAKKNKKKAEKSVETTQETRQPEDKKEASNQNMQEEIIETDDDFEFFDYDEEDEKK